MKRILIIIFYLTALNCSDVFSDIIDVNVSPGTSTQKSKVNVQLLIPASANQRTLPIERALSSNFAAPRLKTRRVNLDWVIDCTVLDPSSSSGVFILDGKAIGKLGSISGGCSTSPSTISESVSIPRKVKTAILAKVLSQPLIKLSRTNRLRQSVAVSYRRTFRDSSGVAIQDTDSATLIFDVVVLAGLDASANESALVRVKGNTSSSFQSISQSASRPTRVSWNAEIESSGEGSRLTVRTDRIEFRTRSGQLLQSQPKRLSEVFDPRFASVGETDHSKLLSLSNILLSPAHALTSALSRINFNESISIPAGVINRARQSGSPIVRIVRLFTDGNNRIEAFIDIPLSGQAGAGFQVTRVDVRFSGGERLKVITQKEPLQLIADINYVGTGFLKAIWEVAPVTAGGVPFFRPLPASSQTLQNADFSGTTFGTRQTRTLVRQYLNSFQRASFRSPTLPTNQIGQYLVRLRIDSPDLLFETPVIEYFVGSANNSAPIALDQVIPMTINSPANDAEVKVGSELSWQAVGLTVAYRYEIYSDGALSSDMISGAVIPGDQETASLSALVADRLQPDRVYWWRVVAIDKNGLEHGASPTQKLRLAR